MTKKPTNWSPLVRHNWSQNVGLLYPLFDDVMALVDEGMAATDVLMGSPLKNRTESERFYWVARAVGAVAAVPFLSHPTDVAKVIEAIAPPFRGQIYSTLVVPIPS